MKRETAEELKQALEQNHGFVQGPGFIAMSINLYREAMGVGDDADLAASVAACKEAMEARKRGEAISIDEAWRRLNQKYGTES